MKNIVLKISSFILAIFMLIIIACGCTADKSDLTLISDETGIFSEIETVTKISGKGFTPDRAKETTSSPELKSKEVAVTKMATEKATIPTTEPTTKVEYTEPPV